jgi:uncharacterized membrane protein
VAGELRNKLGEEHVSVYIPTTPNPTGGYMLLVPKSRLIELDMTVDQALKYIISMGVAAPPPILDATPTASAPPAIAAPPDANVRN